jgi:hypothetical protein
MKIYHYNPVTLQYIGEGLADQDPLEQGKWLVPANATLVNPLPTQDSKTIHFVNGQWVYQDIPQVEPEPEQIELTYAQKRATEYPDFRDYLDGVVKGDQAQIQAYIDACNAVKNKYPKGQV